MAIYVRERYGNQRSSGSRGTVKKFN